MRVVRVAAPAIVRALLLLAVIFPVNPRTLFGQTEKMTVAPPPRAALLFATGLFPLEIPRLALIVRPQVRGGPVCVGCKQLYVRRGLESPHLGYSLFSSDAY